MDWAQDFCLSCDKQTSGEAYCSQACRLLDIEQSVSSTPTSSSTTAPPVSWSTSGLGAGSGLYLSPPLDFSAYKPPKKEQLPQLQSTPRSSLSYTFPTQPTSMSSSNSTNRALTPSSSQSSLSSMGSTSTQEGCLSDKARTELRGYASSFDQVRDWKRRMTTT